ncbi:MAG: glycosyl transferase [Candidatus Eremiobacteraeota bacterium]|nr:glycosyl transferase [Candidatus Eremiobacteraeota bacterium]MBV9055452.1 glycosyl transferase [Candidatus Eremiobacteraeota bacterium]MBV9699802.1 glycosyl transferase [Candidatus Eremiobacteraeota bacterium]
MVTTDNPLLLAATILFIVSQVLYALTLLINGYFLTQPIDWVDMSEPIREPESQWPYIVLFYPVLRELEATMRTTMLSLAKIEYPKDRCRVVAIPNANDTDTVASLRRLMEEFPFLEMLEVPPTSDPSWQIVWDAWDKNPNVYWWHQGRRAGVKDLPPKKTRQLIYALYHTARSLAHEKDLAINYIDADSCPPVDHFTAAAIGLKRYDVLQATNVAGNLNASLPASFHSFDHMAWDGHLYPHLSSHGRLPFWVLGKGLFYRVTDLLELGGFHPWVTIEDPEVGLRYWINGKRLGVIANPLIEEVPKTWWGGVTQRKRWICGFFQALGKPLHYMGFSWWQRVKARLVFVPCLSLWTNLIGVPMGIWALTEFAVHPGLLPLWTFWLACFNVALFAIYMVLLYANTWRRTRLVSTRWTARAWYMLRINPAFAMVWWFLWIIPLAIGFRMYLLDQGLAWQRTEKIDANKMLIRRKLLGLRIGREATLERGANPMLINAREESNVE